MFSLIVRNINGSWCPKCRICRFKFGGTTKLYRVKKLTENRSLSVRSRDIYLKKLKPPDAKKVCFRLNRNFFEI